MYKGMLVAELATGPGAAERYLSRFICAYERSLDLQ
jgi:hypothetical protein